MKIVLTFLPHFKDQGTSMVKETILILDTDKNVAWTLKTLLENEEYPVIVADTIERALKNLSEFQVAALITEYRIENVFTLDAIRDLKERSSEPYVMMITNEEVEEEEYGKILEARVDDFFVKPLSIRKILLHLQKGLRHRRLVLEKNRLEKVVATFSHSNPSENFLCLNSETKTIG